jgi:hypothetical protein
LCKVQTPLHRDRQADYILEKKVLIELDKSIVRLGKRYASAPDANAKLKNYISSALATLKHDDLSWPDAWENMIYDVECSLAIAHVLAAKV